MKKWLKVALGVVACTAVAVGYVLVDLQHAFQQPPLAGQLQRATLMVAQQPRTYNYYVPAKPAQAPALVFMLHGSDGNGAAMRKLSHFQFDLLADSQGFITVYPDGYKGYWNDCRKSADYAARLDNVDDPAFFRAMVADLVARLHADPARVYALGLSNGGHMVYRLALEMPETFVALAAVAANLPEAANLGCTPSGKPVSIAVLNGTSDWINPYNGGLVKLFGNSSRGVVRSSAQTIAYWNQLAGATAPAVVQRMPQLDGRATTWIDKQTWRGGNGTEMRLYTLNGSGHVLPSRISSVMDTFLGGAATDMESATELWSFFAAHHN